jgi:hypothetical protein
MDFDPITADDPVDRVDRDGSFQELVPFDPVAGFVSALRTKFRGRPPLRVDPALFVMIGRGRSRTDTK